MRYSRILRNRGGAGPLGAPNTCFDSKPSAQCVPPGVQQSGPQSQLSLLAVGPLGQHQWKGGYKEVNGSLGKMGTLGNSTYSTGLILLKL